MASIVAGADHTCALSSEGQIWCWGDNTVRQLGDPLLPASMDTPVRLPALPEDISVPVIGLGPSHTCIGDELDQARIACTGRGDSGQLSDVQRTRANAWVGVNRNGSTKPVASIALGVAHSCALIQPGGTVLCWGDDSFGQIGRGADPLYGPVEVLIARE